MLLCVSALMHCRFLFVPCCGCVKGGSWGPRDRCVDEYWSHPHTDVCVCVAGFYAGVLYKPCCDRELQIYLFLFCHPQAAALASQFVPNFLGVAFLEVVPPEQQPQEAVRELESRDTVPFLVQLFPFEAGSTRAEDFLEALPSVGDSFVSHTHTYIYIYVHIHAYMHMYMYIHTAAAAAAGLLQHTFWWKGGDWRHFCVCARVV